MILRKNKKNSRKTLGVIIVLILFPAALFSLNGCFKNVMPREALPDIIWPKPPDIPRIRFVNSISKPEHMNIARSPGKNFLRYFFGKTTAPMVSPNGIATDSEGRLYVVDNNLRVVHVYDSKENSNYTFPGKETAFISPIDVALDSRGRIFVTDSIEAVVKVFNNHGKKFMRNIGKGLLKRPTGITVNNMTGELLVVDTLSSEVLVYDLDTFKYKWRLGTEGSEPGLLHYPISVFVSHEGNIIVSDSLNFRIQVFSSDGTFLHAFGKPGNGPGYFSRPKGVASDSQGNIYVVDALFDNVQIFNKEGRMLMAFGSPGYDYGHFWLPSGIFIDSNDRIYVSDTYNNRVQVFEYMKGD